MHNLAPKAARKLKLTKEDCEAVNPKLIYCHIRGYAAGPQENDLASNPVAEAATGVMEGNVINGRPSRLGPSYHDQFAGAYAVIGILSSLKGVGYGSGNMPMPIVSGQDAEVPSIKSMQRGEQYSTIFKDTRDLARVLRDG